MPSMSRRPSQALPGLTTVPAYGRPPLPLGPPGLSTPQGSAASRGPISGSGIPQAPAAMRAPSDGLAIPQGPAAMRVSIDGPVPQGPAAMRLQTDGPVPRGLAALGTGPPIPQAPAAMRIPIPGPAASQASAPVIGSSNGILPVAQQSLPPKPPVSMGQALPPSTLPRSGSSDLEDGEVSESTSPTVPSTSEPLHLAHNLVREMHSWGLSYHDLVKEGINADLLRSLFVENGLPIPQIPVRAPKEPLPPKPPPPAQPDRKALIAQKLAAKNILPIPKPSVPADKTRTVSPAVQTQITETPVDDTPPVSTPTKSVSSAPANADMKRRLQTELARKKMEALRLKSQQAPMEPSVVAPTVVVPPSGDEKSNPSSGMSTPVSASRIAKTARLKASDFLSKTVAKDKRSLAQPHTEVIIDVSDGEQGDDEDAGETVADNAGLKKTELEIEMMNRKIAEMEERIKAKQTPKSPERARPDDPSTPPPSQLQFGLDQISEEDLQAKVEAILDQAAHTSPPLGKASPASSNAPQGKHLARVADIRRGLPLLTQEIGKAQERLDALQKQEAHLRLQIDKGVAGKMQLELELEKLEVLIANDAPDRPPAVAQAVPEPISESDQEVDIELDSSSDEGCISESDRSFDTDEATTALEILANASDKKPATQPALLDDGDEEMYEPPIEINPAEILPSPNSNHVPSGSPTDEYDPDQALSEPKPQEAGAARSEGHATPSGSSTTTATTEQVARKASLLPFGHFQPYDFPLRQFRTSV